MLSLILTTDNFRLFIIQSDPDARASVMFFLENCFISAFHGH